MMTTTIMFNGLEFNGRLDSSLPASYLTHRVACQFGCINDVAISVNLDNNTSIPCVLNFSVYEKLTTDCVLGLDFFIRIKEHLRAYIYMVFKSY